MCQQCVDAVKRLYPELPDADYGEFLMGTTSYPFDDGEIIEQQLATMKANTDGSIGAAYAYADRIMEEQMKLSDVEALAEPSNEKANA